MPTFDTGVAGTVVLWGACALAGLALGLLVYATGMAWRLRASPAGPDPEGDRGLLRQRAGNASAGLRGAIFLMPLFLPLAHAVPLPSVRASLARRYARAGWPGGLRDDEVLALGYLAGVLIALPLVGLIALVEPLLAPLGLVAIAGGPGLVSMVLDRQGKARELAITRAMPFVLDLLVLTMRAGASLHQAVERVALDYARHPVGTEFRAVLDDLDMGLTTSEAFKDLAERAPIDAVKNFADDLVGGEELGRPLADIFERQANRARSRRVQEAVETAGRAKVMVLIPGMLVFVAALILLFAPFVVRYYYGGFSGMMGS